MNCLKSSSFQASKPSSFRAFLKSCGTVQELKALIALSPKGCLRGSEALRKEVFMKEIVISGSLRKIGRLLFVFSIFVILICMNSVMGAKEDLRSIKGKCSGIVLKDISGKEVKFTDYIGKRLIIVFWSPRCSHCVDMIEGLKKIYNDYKRKVELISLLMIRVDDKVKKAIKIYDIPYAVYEKNEELIDCLGGVWMYPTIYFIDEKGEIRKVTEGEQEEDYLRYLIDRKLGVEECKCKIAVKDRGNK